MGCFPCASPQSLSSAGGLRGFPTQAANVGVISGLFRDNAIEHGNYYKVGIILGLYLDAQRIPISLIPDVRHSNLLDFVQPKPRSA